MNKHWVPEIMYEGEADGSLAATIPFIPVPRDEEMPKVLFIFESKATGDVEPGQEGEEIPVTDLELHQYADMMVLKEKLDFDTFDKVRAALGLEPMSVAYGKGMDINYRIKDNLISKK